MVLRPDSRRPVKIGSHVALGAAGRWPLIGPATSPSTDQMHAPALSRLPTVDCQFMLLSTIASRGDINLAQGNNVPVLRRGHISNHPTPSIVSADGSRARTDVCSLSETHIRFP
ncbi:hypothetical protein WOLCODRAFT_148164 [Wolfiporia cocos MD-104 SS10]|uniref:Uncharacterized protein n=1 Tax=Wolfiporia cocos (strain MD-104) TaxID=742152 RepID=A0A2H3IVT1_WOLCO|nr:hypothetical protein WOLCODRAFT_148164 [Wolfiporia cocos MD-104 SS10]